MKCARCGCKDEDHCKGKVSHVHGHKQNYTTTITCVSRHCLAPMCSCVQFVEPKRRKKAA